MEEEATGITASSEFGGLQRVKASGRKAKRRLRHRREGYCELAYVVWIFPLMMSLSYRSENLSASGFDLEFTSCYNRIRMCSPYDYTINLYAKLALHCYNYQEGKNFKLVRSEKYSTLSTSELHYYITFGAMDPGCKVHTFQTLFSYASRAHASTHVIDTYRTLACRPRCNNRQDGSWDVDKAIDQFYKSAMPTWLSDEALATDSNKYHVVQDSELHENDWLHLFMELAFFSKADYELDDSPLLEINKVVVQTKEDYITEAREKLKADNAIFYISYKYKGVSSMCFAGNHKAVVRKTMDGKLGHMTLEVAFERASDPPSSSK